MSKARNLSEVREAAERLFDLKQKKAELEQLIQESEDRIKGYMSDKNKEELVVGTINIKYRPIVSSKFDSKNFKLNNPDLYNQWCVESISYRFDIKPYKSK